MTTSADLHASVRRFVLATSGLGALAVAGVLGLSMTVWSDLTVAWQTTPQVLLAFVALTTVGQILFVKVRHGATNEELNFYEVVTAAGILLLAPPVILVASLAGMLLGELIIRRERIKIAYNLGNYAASTSAMIATYWVLTLLLLSDPQVQDRSTTGMLSPQSVFALMMGSAVFTTVNLALLGRLLHVTTGASMREVVSEEWRLSGLMAIGSVGIGTVAVALRETPAVLPFAFLPAVALWYAYGASAQHAEARERNRWLVILGGALAQHGRGTDVLDDSAEAIRQIVGAPEMRILDANAGGDESAERVLASTWTLPGPRPLAEDELPAGWHTGVVTRLDLGTANPGALMLGSRARYRRRWVGGTTQGWSLAESDAPILGAMVASVGSAMRAGAAFTALAEETAKLTAVVDNTSDGIAMVDDTGRVRLWSQTMARMTGVPADHLLGDLSTAPEIVQTLVRASRQSGRRDDGSPSPVHVQLVRGDGEELEVLVSTVRVREAAASAGAVGSGWVSILTVHDETRERRVERMKTDFLATISHELRTPITPIKGYAHLLATRGDRVSPEKRAQALRVISDRADHLTRLVGDLLLASQVSDGAHLAIEMGVEDLGEVVQRAVASFPEMVPRIEVRLPDEPVPVQCDRIRAEQCLANLIGNAEKYAPQDSPVEITVEVVGLHAQVHVRDHGTGIPPDEREKVFERFYRREDPFTMRTGGTGLGLHIARELAVAMGGGLTLQAPAEGSGAEFVLHLLTEEAPAPARSGTQRSSSRPAGLARPSGLPPIGSPSASVAPGSSGWPGSSDLPRPSDTQGATEEPAAEAEADGTMGPSPREQRAAM